MRDREQFFVGQDIPSHSDIYVHRIIGMCIPEIAGKTYRPMGRSENSTSEELLGISMTQLKKHSVVCVNGDRLVESGWGEDVAHVPNKDQSRTVSIVHKNVRLQERQQLAVLSHYPDYVEDGPSVLLRY